MIEKIINGNNIDVLKTFPDNYFDSVVTDPPYGISFMGKKWDYDVPSVETWKEVYRVLKPGGHIIVACGTRTQHRMAVNIEDAGFEIRDLVAWLYGSGFPKSMDVSKALDKHLGAEREVVGKGKSGKTALFDKMRDEASYGEYDITEAATDFGKQYEGWGTALKPAMELWTLARKPLIGTVAENVIEYGTGGINIDECRVDYEDTQNPATNPKYRYTNDYKVPKGGQESNGAVKFTSSKNGINISGRFPANVIHDGSDEVVKGFPNVVGSKGSGLTPTEARSTFNNSLYGINRVGYDDEGSASRFFYVPKASQSERNFGLDNFEAKRSADRVKDDGVGGNNPRNRTNIPRKNIHPTVKPIELMQYLVKMITPKGGIVLDLYAGSGSTLIAAKLEKFQYVGIEREQEYVDIINARLKAHVVEYDIFDFMDNE